MDEELRDLCIEVNKRFGWDDRDSGRRFIAREIGEDVDADLGGNTVSLFTSDYLLEKLPTSIEVAHTEYWRSLGVTPNGKTHVASYSNPNEPKIYQIKTTSNTPLKALLKLTLALKEAGEL